MKKADVQTRIQKLLDSYVANGEETGLQVTAYFQGQLVVDAWAGRTASGADATPVTGDTFFPVFSTTKGVAATMLHILAERGKLNYDDRVARYWPEFAANGKAHVTIRQALSHAAGIPQIPDDWDLTNLGDWNAVCARVAQLQPIWPPGTNNEYHAITFGWIIGEIVRRVDGRPFTQFMNDEICRPLGITGMYVGIPAKFKGIIAILEEPEPAPVQPNSLGFYSIPVRIQPLCEWANRPEIQRACIPASNGIMSARAVARMYAALLPGGIKGVELLPQARIKIATERQSTTMPMSLGYFLGMPTSPMGPRASAFGHAGYGGSIGFADPEYGLACGLTKNLFSRNAAQNRILNELRDAFAIPQV
jgi:CubicO group peptidase (beta-lactamase class C family)